MTHRKLAIALFLASIFAPGWALAYIGPGAGISAIGAVFSVLTAVFFGIVGFVWYPVKRLIRAFKRKPSEPEEQ